MIDPTARRINQFSQYVIVLIEGERMQLFEKLGFTYLEPICCPGGPKHVR